MAAQAGAFELFFYRLTRRASLYDYYGRQVFQEARSISDDLLRYAQISAHAKGTHRSPRRFAQGRLYLENGAAEFYERLYRPTLILSPKTPGPTVQSFDFLPAVLE